MSQEDEKALIRISNAITLKDVVTFVSMAVAITLAWGVFGTRLTVAEKELVYQSKSIEQQQKQIDAVKEKMEKMEIRLRDNEDTIHQLWARKYGNGQP